MLLEPVKAHRHQCGVAQAALKQDYRIDWWGTAAFPKGSVLVAGMGLSGTGIPYAAWRVGVFADMTDLIVVVRRVMSMGFVV